MSLRKKSSLYICLAVFAGTFPLSALSETLAEGLCLPGTSSTTLANTSLATQLGWEPDPTNRCGGYYIEDPFTYPIQVEKNNLVEIVSNQTLFSQHGTSILEGKVSVTRNGQQMTMNKACLYRDPNTGKLSAMDMIGNVHLREPNTLVIGKTGHYNFETKSKSLLDIIYRSTMLSRYKIVGSKVAPGSIEKKRKIMGLTAWGTAKEFSQTEPRIYELRSASYSTCPPSDYPSWRVKASHIVLNKDSGRGYATNARLLVKGVPIFYAPYINFPIDSRRKSGFLWPAMGVRGSYGPFVLAPFYWNMAPNYDMTITPGLLMKRGVQFTDNFRYLTTTSSGNLNVTVLPGDRAFDDFQDATYERYHTSPDPITRAELTRLTNASSTRKTLSWKDNSTFSEHWFSHINFSYVSDDYYYKNFGVNSSQNTETQVLQEGDVNFKSQHWEFITRLQGYQTLHPVTEPGQAPVQNQYRRLPQVVLNGDYPDQPGGFEYFIGNEATHFDILKMPGINSLPPVGDRANTQPGVSLPLTWPFFYVTPRAQVALTNYSLNQTDNPNVPANNSILHVTNVPHNINRAVPIIDVLAGFSMNRNTTLFSRTFQQTLEPQLYYVYIPYRNQSDIPVFDTTVTQLNYDQIFRYNRFSGIDRIGDANQVGLGVTSRFIDQDSGFEKLRLGVGEIVYFANRRVTLCSNNPLTPGIAPCTDNPNNNSNFQRLSPLSGLIDYHVSNAWSFIGDGIWNPADKEMDNASLGLRYYPDAMHLLNLSYSFARIGDIQSGITVNSPHNNLNTTDLSFAWPVTHNVSTLGRWSQSWDTNQLQNLLYGLQYDTCCWSVRLVGNRSFVGLNPDNKQTLQYTNEFYVQFSLKGLGNIGPDPSGLLTSILGYNTSRFGQEI